MNFGYIRVRYLVWRESWKAYVVREVCIHDNDKVTGDKVQTMDVCRPESASESDKIVETQVKDLPKTKLASTGLQVLLKFK
jgi:hypothetical protein